jgi:hypothetical protein
MAAIMPIATRVNSIEARSRIGCPFSAANQIKCSGSILARKLQQSLKLRARGKRRLLATRTAGALRRILGTVQILAAQQGGAALALGVAALLE